MVRDKLRHSYQNLPRNLNILPQNLFFSPRNPWRFPMGNNGCTPVRFKFSVKDVTNGRLNYAKLRKNLKTFRSRVGKKCMFLHFVGCFAVFRAEIICKHCFLRGFRVILCRVFRKFAPVLCGCSLPWGRMLPENRMERMGGLAAFEQRLVLSARCSLSCAKKLLHSTLKFGRATCSTCIFLSF